MKLALGGSSFHFIELHFSLIKNKNPHCRKSLSNNGDLSLKLLIGISKPDAVRLQVPCLYQ